MTNAEREEFSTAFPQAEIRIFDYTLYPEYFECIAPDGSDRNNHRQDQAVLSVLAHQLGIARDVPSAPYGFKMHQDILEPYRTN